MDASGSSHLVAGRAALPPSVRLRYGNTWLHDLQTLADAGLKDAAIIYVTTPQERHSRDQLAVSIKDVAGRESATVFVRTSDSVSQLMRSAQDALGVPVDAQQLIFGGEVLSPSDSLAGCHIVEGSTVQMAVGRRRVQEQQMSPGGTWR